MQKRLKPMADRPGYFRDEYTGEYVNIEDFGPFETSLPFEGREWVWKRQTGSQHVIKGWRFSVAEWPTDQVAMQQQVRLLVIGREEASRAVASITTSTAKQEALRSVRDRELEGLDDFYVPHNNEISIVLQERAVVEVGFRIHIYGLRKTSFY